MEIFFQSPDLRRFRIRVTNKIKKLLFILDQDKIGADKKVWMK